MGYKVFLSHNVARDDYSLVAHITNSLTRHGVEVFVPEWYPRYIRETLNRFASAQIAASDLVLAIVTSPSSRSTKMAAEIGFALGKGKPVVALVEGGINTEGFLATAPRLEFTRLPLNSYYQAAEEVVEHVKKKKEWKETTQGLLGLTLVGLFLWLLSQRGKEA